MSFPTTGPVDETSARASCEALPWAELTNPFGDETDVFKVRDRIFAILTVGAVPARVSLKCPPEHGAALVKEYESVIPGFHLNKKHWITITLGGDVPAGLVDDLIVNSYGVVISGLPLSRRPPLAPGDHDT